MIDQSMNDAGSLNGSERPTTTQGKRMDSSDDRERRTVQFNGALDHQQCFVCDDPIGENCFCKVHRKEGGPIRLCCPSCAIQYIDSARPPADSAEEELRAYEKSTHFFMGEDKPWS